MNFTTKHFMKRICIFCAFSLIQMYKIIRNNTTLNFESLGTPSLLLVLSFFNFQVRSSRVLPKSTVLAYNKGNRLYSEPPLDSVFLNPLYVYTLRSERSGTRRLCTHCENFRVLISIAEIFCGSNFTIISSYRRPTRTLRFFYLLISSQSTKYSIS
jgi:hypothetical protein